MSDPKYPAFKFIKFAYKAYKPYFFIVIFGSLVSAGWAMFNVYSLSLILKYLENGDLNVALIAGLVVVAANLLFNFLNKLFTRLKEISEVKSKEAIHQRMSKKLMKLPFRYLEDPMYLDLKDRAKFAVENQSAISQFLNGLAKIVQVVITLIGLLAIILTFDIILLAILSISVILSVLLVFLSLKTQYSLYKNLIPINRKFGYYFDTISNEKNAKDYRFSSIGRLIKKQYLLYAENIKQFFTTTAMRQGIYESLAKLVKYVETGFVYGFIAIKSITRKLPISQFSLYISSSISFSTNLSELIEVGLHFARVVDYLVPFIQLIELKEEKDEGSKDASPIETIEFENVSFHYPRSEELILKNLSFTINKGEKISIVGLNGAGKTTLIKLLCRLYKPTSGRILVNNIPINEYDYDKYTKHISAIFQDYKMFAYTIKENITGGEDEQKAYEVSCMVGLKDKIDSLPYGINTLYSKVYDEEGVELSGGEAQKVAIARALYKNSSLVILDEPTSALDPLAEAEIYKNFNELVLDKTAIYISHRMSSSVFCDKILVIDKGEIADFAPHHELVKKTDSLYSILFNSQAKNYSE